MSVLLMVILQNLNILSPLYFILQRLSQNSSYPGIILVIDLSWFGVLNIERHHKMSFGHGLLVERHALVLDYLLLIWINMGVRFDRISPGAVEQIIVWLSRSLTSKVTPVRDCRRDIFLVM